MSHEIRRPQQRDRTLLDELLIEDYKKLGITKPPLTSGQMARYTKNAWIAVNESEEPEAITLAGKWKHGDAAPYLPPEEREALLAKTKDMLGQMFGKDRGIFLLSAVSYEEGGALSALVDDPKVRVLEPEKGRAVHVPLLQSKLAAHAFLLGRGFKEGPEGNNMIFGMAVKTVLMTRNDE